MNYPIIRRVVGEPYRPETTLAKQYDAAFRMGRLAFDSELAKCPYHEIALVQQWWRGWYDRAEERAADQEVGGAEIEPPADLISREAAWTLQTPLLQTPPQLDRLHRNQPLRPARSLISLALVIAAIALSAILVALSRSPMAGPTPFVLLAISLCLDIVISAAIVAMVFATLRKPSRRLSGVGDH